MIIGNRVPRRYFLTTGEGESDITQHAGSYHLALRQAGIEMCNIVRYSSILPKGSERVIQPTRSEFTHGEVLECIEASAHAVRGERATAGLTFARLKTQDDDDLGGLVCEYSGSLPAHEAKSQMREMIRELYENGYTQFILGTPEVYVRTVVPTKAYGTALVTLGFLDYRVPVSRS